MENVTFYILLVIIGTIAGILLVLLIIQTMRGMVSHAYAYPHSYRDDHAYYRDRSHWFIIFILFLLGGVSIFYSDNFNEIVSNGQSMRPALDYYDDSPDPNNDPVIKKAEILSIDDPVYADSTEIAQNDVEQLDDHAYPLSDYLTEEYFYIQFSSGGVLGFVLDEAEQLNEKVTELIFIAILNNEYKILAGPYLSKEEARVEARASKLPCYIRTGKDLSLYEGYRK